MGQLDMNDEMREELMDMRKALDGMLSPDYRPVVQKLEEVVKTVSPKASYEGSPQKCIKGLERRQQAYKGLATKGKTWLEVLEKDPTNEEALKALERIASSDLDDMGNTIEGYSFTTGLMKELAKETFETHLQFSQHQATLFELLEGYRAEMTPLEDDYDYSDSQ